MKRIIIILVAISAVVLFALNMPVKTTTTTTEQSIQSEGFCSAPIRSESGLPAEVEEELNMAVLRRINEHREEMNMAAVEFSPPNSST